MPELQSCEPLDRELRTAADLSLAAFLDRVRSPHLLIMCLASTTSTPAIATMLLAPAAGSSRWFQRRLVEVAKRPNSNPFGLMITIGRAANNDIVVEDAGVSKFHAYLHRSPGGWSLTDARSLNGTWVDGVRLAPGTPPARVGDGSVIRLGEGVVMAYLEPAGLYRHLQAARLQPALGSPPC